MGNFYAESVASGGKIFSIAPMLDGNYKKKKLCGNRALTCQVRRLSD